MCTNPPFIGAARQSATHIAPNRNQVRDGGCPSAEHHQNNPSSDHEGSGPNNYSHAVDITVDPPRFDPRDYLASIIANPFWREHLKYIVANFTGWRGAPLQEDVIWDFAENDTHWRTNGGYSHHDAPHVHFSFYPITEQVTTPLFVEGVPTPTPHIGGDRVFVIQPVGTPAGKKPKITGRTMGATLNVAGRCVDLHNGSSLKFDLPTTDPLLRKWVIPPGAGTPIAIGPAAPNRPGGPGVVVVFDNHSTYDAFWS